MATIYLITMMQIDGNNSVIIGIAAFWCCTAMMSRDIEIN